MRDADLGSLTVLYVEDDEDMREQVAHFLHKKCGRVLQAGDGREALEIYRAHRPDMIVSDVMMPEMDGLEFSEIVKRHDAAMPIILMTAFNDSAYLHRAIDIGVDNYVLKPVDLDKLHAAMRKSADLLFKTRELVTSRAQLQAYHHAAEEERALVSDLMKRMMQPERMVDVQVQYRLEPADLVSGDLVAFRRSRNDRLYIMLADSTGHGLPAALNLLPVNQVFYSMVEKGLPLFQIVEEMNWAVKQQSPADRFVSAFVACIDPYNRIIETWNGGIPSAMLVNDAGEVYHSFVPNNLPLGILDRTFIARTDIVQWHCHSQLVIYSDGLVEAEDERGVAWGGDNIRSLLARTAFPGRFDALLAGVHGHLGTRSAFDDMTLLMVDCAM